MWCTNRWISGLVTNVDTGFGVDGVTIAFPGAGSAQTAGGGYYSCAVPYGWTGTSTPAGFGATFTPGSRAFNNITNN